MGLEGTGWGLRWGVFACASGLVDWGDRSCGDWGLSICDSPLCVLVVCECLHPDNASGAVHAGTERMTKGVKQPCHER